MIPASDESSGSSGGVDVPVPPDPTTGLPPSDPTTSGGPPPTGDGSTNGGDPGGSDDGAPATTGQPPPPEVPAGWACDPTYYGAGDGCDCGCGELDPDCPDATAASCEYCIGCNPLIADCTGLVEPEDNSVCLTADCGNGAIEGGEACDGSPPEVQCTDIGFTGGTIGCTASCNADLTTCEGGPEGWTCPPEFYGAADGCDCGCGALDPDCPDATAASCEFCGGVGSCGAIGDDCSVLDPANNAVCL